MKIPTTAILAILLAGVSTLAGPPKQDVHTTYRHRAPSTHEGEKSFRRPAHRNPVADLIDEIFRFRFRLRCSLTVEEVVTASCSARLVRSRGTT